MLRIRVAAVALLALAACADSLGGYGGDPVKPAVAPPTLERVHVVPDTFDRSAVVRVVLKSPRALPATQVDAYKQKPGVVDILWVVANTGSMANERTKLAGNFQRFIDILLQSQTDFHIGTIATDQDLGAQLHGQVPIIDRSTPNPQQAFVDQVTFPPGRVRWEQAFSEMRKFLSTPSLNQGFIRQGAALAVITVADSDDQSFGTPGFYARFLREVKGQGDENLVTFSTISGDLPNGCTPPGEGIYFGSKAEPSPRSIDLARRTGGVVGSICDASFENTLVQIAEALNTLRKIFPLSLKPDPSTITVTVDGQPVPRDTNSGFTYVAAVNAIEFLGSYVPPPSAAINIQYAIAP